MREACEWEGERRAHGAAAAQLQSKSPTSGRSSRQARPPPACCDSTCDCAYLLPGRVPDVELDGTTVGVEYQGVDLHTKRGYVLLFKLAGQVAFDKGRLADAAVTDEDELELGDLFGLQNYATGRERRRQWCELIISEHVQQRESSCNKKQNSIAVDSMTVDLVGLLRGLSIKAASTRSIVRCLKQRGRPPVFLAIVLGERTILNVYCCAGCGKRNGTGRGCFLLGCWFGEQVVARSTTYGCGRSFVWVGETNEEEHDYSGTTEPSVIFF